MQIRSATVADVPAMARLINTYAERGQMLFRAHGELYEKLRDFVVCSAQAQAGIGEAQILGVCALEIVWADLAEVRSLAVDPAWHGKGIGRLLVEAMLAEANRLQIQKVFALTYEQAFFAKLGFHVVEMQTLPHKVWSDCIKCPKREGCDEIAMIRIIRDQPVVDEPATQGAAGSNYEVPTRLVQLGNGKTTQ